MAKSLAAHATALAVGLVVGLCVVGGVDTPRALAADDGPAMRPVEEFQPRIAEGFPNWYIERLKNREQKILDDLGENRHSAAVPSGLVILKTDEWSTDAPITVAFKGGSPRLHALIERIASAWSQYANIKFDFGRDASGQYRTWSPDDIDYQADVRVAFDQIGYWSAVGRDSIDPDIHQPGNQTLNLQGFDRSLPYGFAGIVRHEFGHVLGLEHEHQSPVATCDFRWDDDPGYVSTTDNYGQFIRDPQGRRPGIYTVFGGPPNNWPKQQVDFNMRQLTTQADVPVSAYGFGPFDKLSVMKYYYDDSLFVSGKNSPCYSPGVNHELSDEDKTRVAVWYPKEATTVAARVKQKRDAIEDVLSQLPQSSLLATKLRVRQQELR